MGKMVSDGRPSGGKRPKEGDKDNEEDRVAVAEADNWAAVAVMWQDEDLVQEVMKHMDGFTLASASCVSRTWRRAADDESLWERICTHNWPHHPHHSNNFPNPGPGPGPAPNLNLSRNLQLKRVVQGLGGFRRLFVTYLRPLLHKSLPPPLLPAPSASTTNWAPSTADLVALTAANLPPNSTASTPKLAAKPASCPRRCNHIQAWGRDEVQLSLSLYSIDCFSRLGKISSSPSSLHHHPSSSSSSSSCTTSTTTITSSYKLPN